jgi:hypothetical protein
MPFRTDTPKESPTPTEVDTLVFVDVDGVLNVGAKDTGLGPLILSDANIKHCERLWGNRESERECVSIKRVMAMCSRQLGHGEDSTFTKLATTSPSHISDILVSRLAELIRAAGPNTQVVLSSTWQRPQHRAHRTRLEESIGKYLSKSFTFDATTESQYEHNAEGRLLAIGRFLSRFCAQRRGVAAQGLRVLVLEDFYITQMGVWSCEGARMDSSLCCERYLLQKMYGALGEEFDGSLDITVKVQHTYDEWTTDDGLLIQVGCGLTMNHHQEAMAYLKLGCEDEVLSDCHPSA